MIQWIFFDIGNVILNDDPAMAYFYHQLYQAVQQNGRHVTLEEILAAREHSILVERNGKHYEVVGKKFLDPRTWQKVDKQIRRALAENWAEFSPLIPGIVPVIQRLAGQADNPALTGRWQRPISKFNLGLIANQPREAIHVLEQHGLLKYFRIHGISQIVGMTKPDPAIFHWALAQAHAKPESTIMIGDRVDNDICPARAIGMKTIWLKLQQSRKGYQPKAGFEQRYFESLRRASASHLPPKNAAETPDVMVEDFDAIMSAIEQLQGESIS